LASESIDSMAATLPRVAKNARRSISITASR
jgi:hypothetical protein